MCHYLTIFVLEPRFSCSRFYLISRQAIPFMHIQQNLSGNISEFVVGFDFACLRPIHSILCGIEQILGAGCLYSIAPSHTCDEHPQENSFVACSETNHSVSQTAIYCDDSFVCAFGTVFVHIKDRVATDIRVSLSRRTVFYESKQLSSIHSHAYTFCQSEKSSGTNILVSFK